VFFGFLWGGVTVASWFLGFILHDAFLILAGILSLIAIIVGFNHIYDEW
jgi:hypothetical protein